MQYLLNHSVIFLLLVANTKQQYWLTRLEARITNTKHISIGASYKRIEIEMTLHQIDAEKKNRSILNEIHIAIDEEPIWEAWTGCVIYNCNSFNRYTHTVEAKCFLQTSLPNVATKKIVGKTNPIDKANMHVNAAAHPAESRTSSKVTASLNRLSK